MSSVHAGNPQVDAARQVLCREFAQSINDNKFTVRVRLVETAGKPAEALFQAHDGRGWHKAGEPITDRLFVKALNETLEMLASTEHHDAWSVRQQSHADGHDTELKFHREKLAGYLGDKLESALMGLLFRDHHDSSQDVRRSIRTPRPAQGRK
jgi:hypothetical protein